MPFINPDNGALTVFNLFDTATREDQETLLNTMQGIIEGANYPGWRSSTLHGGLDKPCAANYIQWRSVEDLQERYEGENFKHNTVPYFTELTTSVHLLKTEVVATHKHPSLDAIEISPDRDDFTVIVLMGVEPGNQAALVDLFAKPDEYMHEVPGYRSNSILRALDGDLVVNYAQWESRAAYEAFHTMPEEERPVHARRMRATARPLLTSRSSNTYEVVFARSAPGQPAGER
ncbi:antibiotic biosynthesis monooxygenase family protein [Streptomyces sp. 891-h]|uniref:antibiotic biosynthesis monooxygenase family protein n=1 Tax=unclassified Streptomyces TaxID=2593676 RepID=UPI001FA9FC15|nr:antibiotic biosynthesis monooxygenase family protein [Streptomyces sp. 891-h]UNZ20460.1 antibiotic biosynthesis monooxygenase [Streptomyces sp. 891-h]